MLIPYLKVQRIITNTHHASQSRGKASNLGPKKYEGVETFIIRFRQTRHSVVISREIGINEPF
jgi:hypothetical protein